MNPSQTIIVVVAAVNLAVMLLFPPHDSLSMWRGGVPSFDAFYFVFDRHYNKQTNGDLLTLEVMWILINTAIGLLLLRRPGVGPISRRAGVLAVVAVNLALVLLFPPFENYSSTTRMSGTWFDGFYFVFGDKWQRRFFVPLLYLELIWVLLNGAVLWLLFRFSPPSPPSPPGET